MEIMSSLESLLFQQWLMDGSFQSHLPKEILNNIEIIPPRALLHTWQDIHITLAFRPNFSMMAWTYHPPLNQLFLWQHNPITLPSAKFFSWYDGHINWIQWVKTEKNMIYLSLIGSICFLTQNLQVLFLLHFCFH